MPKRKMKDDGKRAKKLNLETQCSSHYTERRDYLVTQSITWPDSDLLKLLKCIEKNIPENDNLPYCCRMEGIWHNFTFKKYSAAECKQVWSALMARTRDFRLLREIVTDTKSLIHSSRQSTRKDVVKHPTKPKQPLNSFMLFCTKKRKKIIKENPHLSPTEISQVLGEQYKQLSREQMDKYKQRAQAAREKYIEELKSFYLEHPDQIPQKGIRSKALQFEAGEGPPRKPRTPFQLFVEIESTRDDQDTDQQNYRDVWNEMTDNAKLFWINWAQKQYEEYIKRLEIYLKDNPKYESGKVKVLSRKEREIIEQFSGKPKRPPRSGYHLFSKLIIEKEDMRKIDNKQATNYVAERWKACSEEEKTHYNTRVAQMWEEYHREMDEFKMSLSPEERCNMKDVNVRKAKESKTKEKSKGASGRSVSEPVRPPLTTFDYFVSVYPGEKNPAQIWDEMNDEEKQQYDQELVELKENYVVRLEKYLKSLTKEELASAHRVD